MDFAIYSSEFSKPVSRASKDMPFIWLLPSDGRSVNISLKSFDRLEGFRRGQPRFSIAGPGAGLEVIIGESDPIQIARGKKAGGGSLGSEGGNNGLFSFDAKA